MSPLDEAIIANDQLPEQQRESNVKLGGRFGVSEAAVRRHRRAIRRRSNQADTQTDAFFGVPTQAITSRGKTVRLDDGSYEKITYVPGAVEREEAKRLSYQDLAPILAAPPTKPSWAPSRPATLAVVLSDLQIGKTDARGGTSDTLRRLNSIIGQIADHCARHRYQEILLIDAGDICEGFDNTVSQSQTNDLDLTSQIRTAQAVMAKALKALAAHAPDVTYVAVPSNHCQLRKGVGRNQRVGKPSNDWGLLIQDNIRMATEGRPGYEHVKFAAPNEREESLTVATVDGTHMGVTHGHVCGSKARVADWFRNQAFGHVAGLHRATILLHGHWHNFGVTTLGNNHQIISAPTCDPGSGWFRNQAGDSSQPCALTFELASDTSSAWALWSELPDFPPAA